MSRRPLRGVSMSGGSRGRDSSRVNDVFESDSLGPGQRFENNDAIAQMQEQLRKMQEQIKNLMVGSREEVDTLKAAHEEENKHAAELQEELQRKLEESESKRVAAEKSAAGSGARVVIHEELSVRREDYQAMLRDLSKI